jgi:hypothetical protein
MLEEVWCDQQEQSDCKRTDDAGELGAGAGGFRNWRRELLLLIAKP